MLGPIAHRGPDAWGTYVDPFVGLGHVRLSIIGFADGHQPFVLGQDVLSFNGEIFNHVELRRDLEGLGDRFQTSSDTEVLLRALQRWGLDALPRLNGQFAFLHWNASQRRLVAVRDRYGILPLYFASHDGRIYFASEFKAFDAVPGFTRRLEPGNLLEHGLLWNTLQDRTVWSGIRSVEAGTCLVFDHAGNEKRVRYYHLGEGSRERVPATLEEAKRTLRQKLTDSVALRLRSDVPVGNYLSGGIDSSVITLLTEQLRTDRFRTFSIAFSDPAYDESKYQRQMTARLRTEPFTLLVTDADIRDNFERAIRHGERPVFRTAPVPLLLLSRHVRESGIRVVLTGEAADEILWGYDAFKELKVLRFWSRFPKSRLRPQLIRRLYPHLAHYRDGTQFGQMRMFYEGFLETYDGPLAGLAFRVHNNGILRAYLRPEFRDALNDDLLTERVGALVPPDVTGLSLLQRNQMLEMGTLLPGYLLSSQADRMALANGIEGRFPFLDHNLVEWVFRLPDRFKLPLLSHKHLLREAFRDDLPPDIVDRPKHPYQAPDLRAFFTDGRLCDLAREHLDAAAIESVGVFDRRMAQRFTDKFSRGVPARLGYRDNMVFCFMLSTQIAARHAADASPGSSPISHRTVDVTMGAPTA
jgi:asparagine synthase (glutamine-hydrolysing)